MYLQRCVAYTDISNYNHHVCSHFRINFNFFNIVKRRGSRINFKYTTLVIFLTISLMNYHKNNNLMEFIIDLMNTMLMSHIFHEKRLKFSHSFKKLRLFFTTYVTNDLMYSSIVTKFVISQARKIDFASENRMNQTSQVCTKNYSSHYLQIIKLNVSR